MSMSKTTSWVLDHFDDGTNASTDAVFRSLETDIPTVAADQLLIKVAATSVNPIDTKMRAGLVPALSPDFPAVLHGDFSGTVVAVGSDVSGYSVGDEVYGCAGGVKGTQGALAEHLLANPCFVAHRPKSLPLTDCAALPLVVITAWQGLFEKARVAAGESILVFGGTGGVGHVAAQLAAAEGLKVVTTVGSKDKADLAQGLGLETILYHDESPEEYKARLTQGSGFDVVFDTVGQENLDLAFTLAKEQGKVIAIAARSTHDLSPLHRKGLSLHVVFMLTDLINQNKNSNHQEILSAAARLVDAGKLKPLIHSQRYTPENALAAHHCVEQGKAIGKVLIEME